MENLEQIPAAASKRKKVIINIAIFLLFVLFLVWNVGLEKFLRYLLMGLPQGGIIALIAIGYSMVYGIVLLINFAHGEVFMMSSYFVLTLTLGVDKMPPKIALVLAIFFGFISIAFFRFLGEKKIHDKIMLSLLSVLCAIFMGLGFYYVSKSPINFWLACMISVLLTSMLGMSMDRYAYKPLRKSPRLVPLITAIGISLFLANFAQLVWGSQSRTYPTEILPKTLTVPYMIDGQFLTSEKKEVMPFFELLIKAKQVRVTKKLIVPLVDVFIFFLAVSLMMFVQIFLRKTRTGKAMRACSQDLHAAKLMGIDVDRIISFTFAFGSALAALCSPLYVIKYAPMEPLMGYIVGILAFASAVLGGIGNIPGAMLGGFFIGLIYNFVPLFETLESWRMIKMIREAGWFPGIENWNFLSGITQWRLGIAFLFMLLVILIKPQGLLGSVEAKKRA